MKKLLVCICSIIFTAKAFSQENDKGTIEIIPQIRYGSSFLNGKYVNGIDARGAFRFKLLGDYYFNDRWSFRKGLDYASMGAKNATFDLELNYLFVPVNANWHFGTSRSWNINLGVSLGFFLDGNLDGNEVIGFKTFQLGLSYGIGYKKKVLENFSLLFDVQGFQRTTNISDNLADSSVSTARFSFNV